MRTTLRRRGALAAGLILTLTGAALPGSEARASAAHDSASSLALVAYSTPQEAYDLIIKAFQKTKAGQGVTFTQSYGASGDQSRAVVEGLPADVVAFSLEPDINRLVKAHLVRSSWYRNRYHGFATDSTVVFGVRKGNPKRIHTWNDLLKPGIEVITPNPFTSGGARWNVMAAYGAQLKLHRTKAQAIAYLSRLFDHVSVQDDSARAELQTFVSGKGDVMLGYENEMITAQQKGQKVDYVVPPQSIQIENPVAVTSESKHPTQGNAFVSFLWSSTAQSIFGQKGYWPVRQDVAKRFHFRKPRTLFTIRSLGSWPTVQTEFFDPNTGIMATIERKKGVSP